MFSSLFGHAGTVGLLPTSEKGGVGGWERGVARPKASDRILVEIMQWLSGNASAATWLLPVMQRGYPVAAKSVI